VGTGLGRCFFGLEIETAAATAGTTAAAVVGAVADPNDAAATMVGAVGPGTAGGDKEEPASGTVGKDSAAAGGGRTPPVAPALQLPALLNAAASAAAAACCSFCCCFLSLCKGTALITQSAEHSRRYSSHLAFSAANCLRTEARSPLQHDSGKHSAIRARCLLTSSVSSSCLVCDGR
jgi:hypothetical protein